MEFKGTLISHYHHHIDINMKQIKDTIELYIIRNQEGKFFRSVGYHGYGKSWVDDIVDAKIYLKIGPARSRCTWWTIEYPDYGIPDIIKFSINYKDGIVMDESDRVKKSVKRIEKEKIQQNQWMLDRQIAEKQKEIEKLKEDYFIIEKPKLR